MLMSFFNSSPEQSSYLQAQTRASSLDITENFSRTRWVGGAAFLTASHVKQKAENLLFLFV